MRVKVRIANPWNAGQAAHVAADVNPDLPVAQVPLNLARKLHLPVISAATTGAEPGLPRAYARFDYGRCCTITSVVRTSAGRRVVLGLSTLTGLGLEVDRDTGDLREFELLLL